MSALRGRAPAGQPRPPAPREARTRELDLANRWLRSETTAVSPRLNPAEAAALTRLLESGFRHSMDAAASALSPGERRARLGVAAELLAARTEERNAAAAMPWSLRRSGRGLKSRTRQPVWELEAGA